MSSEGLERLWGELGSPGSTAAPDGTVSDSHWDGTALAAAREPVIVGTQRWLIARCALPETIKMPVPTGGYVGTGMKVSDKTAIQRAQALNPKTA